jgi:ABC-type nitrate/sulfonate/bicarbonate transport system substrate-binding protein
MRKRFIAEHSDAARQFVASTARAIEWARKTPPDVVRSRLRDILQRRNRREEAEYRPVHRTGPLILAADSQLAERVRSWLAAALAPDAGAGQSGSGQNNRS